MLKIGQDLPLDFKTTQHFIGICTPFKYFDGDALLKLSIGPLGKVNGSHTSTPEFADDRIRADAFVVPKARRRELCKFFENTCIVGEELFSLTKERRVIGARLFEHCRTLFGRGLLQRVGEDIFETLPACRIRLNSRRAWLSLLVHSIGKFTVSVA